MSKKDKAVKVGVVTAVISSLFLKRYARYGEGSSAIEALFEGNVWKAKTSFVTNISGFDGTAEGGYVFKPGLAAGFWAGLSAALITYFIVK